MHQWEISEGQEAWENIYLLLVLLVFPKLGGLLEGVQLFVFHELFYCVKVLEKLGLPLKAIFVVALKLCRITIRWKQCQERNGDDVVLSNVNLGSSSRLLYIFLLYTWWSERAISL